ncbi:hypothetical protein PEPIB2_76 (plasmid) [Tritonibacter mobilis]|nr:hypothetical protein PEPIB2_76 [Tritonibacter mobilis]
MLAHEVRLMVARRHRLATVRLQNRNERAKLYLAIGVHVGHVGDHEVATFHSHLVSAFFEGLEIGVTTYQLP